MNLRVPGQKVDERILGEIVEKDCQARKLNKEEAMDRSRWRKQIRDNSPTHQDEWVNVSSDTGSSDLSWRKSREP